MASPQNPLATSTYQLGEPRCITAILCLAGNRHWGMIASPDLTRHFKSGMPVRWAEDPASVNQLSQLPDGDQDAGEPGSAGYGTEECVETPSHCCRFADMQRLR
jgi:hypothetical protein